MNLYRKTTIGEALAEAVQELRGKNEVSDQQAGAVMETFDKAGGVADPK